MFKCRLHVAKFKIALFIVSVVVFILYSSWAVWSLSWQSNSRARSSMNRNAFMSWQPPGFAGINNQMLLLATSPIFNPLPERAVVPPDVWFLSRRYPQQFVERHRRLIGEIFEEGPLSKFYSLETDVVTAQPVVVGTMAEAKQLSAKHLAAKHHFIIYGSEQTEEYWSFMFWRYVIFGVLLRQSQFADVLEAFVFKDPVKSLTELALKNRKYHVMQSIGMHIRTFSKSDVVNGANVCHVTAWYHPLAWYYNCKPEASDYQRYIDLYPRDKLIFIAADDQSSSIVRSLIETYQSRVFFLRDIVDVQMNNYTTSRIPLQAIEALIEGELLYHCDVMIGNFWSSFSTIAAVRRRFRKTYLVCFSFFTWSQRIVVASLVYLILRKLIKIAKQFLK